MISLESLSMSYKYVFTTLETLPMKKLMMEYMTTCLMHKMLKCKEKESQAKNAPMMSCQSKVGTSPSLQGIRMCPYWGKPGYIPQLCYNTKKRKNVKNAKDEDKFAFATQQGVRSMNVYKWIMDSGATKHMTLHKATFKHPRRNFLMQCVLSWWQYGRSYQYGIHYSCSWNLRQNE